MFKYSTQRVDDVEKTTREFRLSMKAKRRIGSGAYSNVYAIAGSDKVVKVVEGEDDRYLAFVKRLAKQKVSNPMLPAIDSATKFYRGSEWKLVVVMERLDELTNVVGEGAADDVAEIVEKMLSDNWRKKHNRSKQKDTSYGIALLFNQPGAYQMISHAAKIIGHPDDYDFHSGNIMVRDKSQLVLTDPVS